MGHHALISCPCILKVEWYYVVAVHSCRRYEGHIFRIRREHGDLIVSLVGV